MSLQYGLIETIFSCIELDCSPCHTGVCCGFTFDCCSPQSSCLSRFVFVTECMTQRGWWSTLQGVVEHSPAGGGALSSCLFTPPSTAHQSRRWHVNRSKSTVSPLLNARAASRSTSSTVPHNANNSTIEKTCYLIRSNRLCYILCYFSQKYG